MRSPLNQALIAAYTKEAASDATNKSKLEAAAAANTVYNNELAATANTGESPCDYV